MDLHHAFDKACKAMTATCLCYSTTTGSEHSPRTCVDEHVVHLDIKMH